MQVTTEAKPFVETIHIDESSSLSPYAQIKEQIKLAYMYGRLKAGDIMPSIRTLARRLGVGDAVVRRAYEELTELGFLSAEPRKHLMVTETLSRPPRVENIAQECENECDRLLAWAKRNDVSAIALGRLFLRRATQSETGTPSYLYVDASAASAKTFAAMISKAWEIPVLDLSLEEAAKLSRSELGRFTAILVNSYRYESLLEALKGRRKKGIYAVKMRLHPRFINRIRRQPPGSSVLLVLPDQDALRVGKTAVDYIQEEVGTKVSVEAAAFGKIKDLASLAANGRYSLVIVSRHIWHLVPEKAKRRPGVIPNENQMNMESLEKIRIAAGVIV